MAMAAVLNHMADDAAGLQILLFETLDQRLLPMLPPAALAEGSMDVDVDVNADAKGLGTWEEVDAVAAQVVTAVVILLRPRNCNMPTQPNYRVFFVCG